MTTRLKVLSWAAALRAALAVGVVLAIILGRPDALAPLLAIVGAYVFCDGLVTLWSGIERAGVGTGSISFLVVGLLGVIAGGVLMASDTGVELRWTVLLTWALAAGALELAAELRLRHEVPHETFLAWSGAAALALGLLMLRGPHGAGGVALLFSGYAAAQMALQLGLALRLRRAAREHEHAIV